MEDFSNFFNDDDYYSSWSWTNYNGLQYDWDDLKKHGTVTETVEEKDGFKTITKTFSSLDGNTKITSTETTPIIDLSKIGRAHV